MFDGLEQDGPSFLGHVFLNRPGADTTTPRSATEGYAGAFHVYGFGAAATGAGAAGGGVRGPISKSVIATEAVRRALATGARAVTVTVAPSARAALSREALRPERVRIGAASGGPRRARSWGPEGHELDAIARPGRAAWRRAASTGAAPAGAG